MVMTRARISATILFIGDPPVFYFLSKRLRVMTIVIVGAKSAELRFRPTAKTASASLLLLFPTSNAAQPLTASPPYGCGVPLTDASLV